MSRAVWPCPVCVSFVPSSCVLCLECRVSCCPLACPVGHRTAQSAENVDKTQPNTHVPIVGRVAHPVSTSGHNSHPIAPSTVHGVAVGGRSGRAAPDVAVRASTGSIRSPDSLTHSEDTVTHPSHIHASTNRDGTDSNRRRASSVSRVRCCPVASSRLGRVASGAAPQAQSS